MDRDEHAVGALAKRFAAHRGKAGLDRLTVSVKGQETRADGVEPVEAELPQPLAFDQDPVVRVPVGQEFPCQRGGIQVLRRQEADSSMSRRTLEAISRVSTA